MNPSRIGLGVTVCRLVLLACSQQTEVVSRGTVVRLISKGSNTGVTPLGERFVLRYELRPAGQTTLAWGRNSSLDLQKLLPTTNPQGVDIPQPVTDSFALPQPLSPGTYTLSLVGFDPTGYHNTLALAT
jgi:hypothetical protein